MPKTCNHTGCNNRVFSKGLCTGHWVRAHAKPLQRMAIKNNGSGRINPVSEKQRLRHTQYLQQNKAYLKVNKLCKAELNGCKVHSTEVHHMRGRIGQLLLDENYWLPVCSNCHRLIEDNPEMARERGLSMSRHKKTDSYDKNM